MTRLVGPVKPVGSTEVDEQRLENLKTMIDLVDSLIGDVLTVAQYRNRTEYSLRESGKRAHDFLEELDDYVPSRQSR